MTKSASHLTVRGINHHFLFQLFNFLLQPFVEIVVPIQMQRLLAAAARIGRAAGGVPLFLAGRAPTSGVKGIPDRAAGTLPVRLTIRFPTAFGAFYFDVACHLILLGRVGI